MPVKNYGIYLAYPPTVDLRTAGLGRHLAMLLKGAASLEDVRFTIICPSWSREMLRILFDAEQVPEKQYEIISPKGQPYILYCFELWRAFCARARQKLSKRQRITLKIQATIESLWLRLTTRMVSIYGPLSLGVFLGEILIIVPPLLLLGLIVSPFIIFAIGVRAFKMGAGRILSPFTKRWSTLVARLTRILATPQKDGWVLRLYDEMQKAETQRMQQAIDSLTNVKAWYSPTAFWPSFNNIRAPRLMCVPDVVLREFPSGFASLGGDHFLNTFDAIKRSIQGSENFVTYSDSVKWQTLVDEYAVKASNITVIKHAPSDLSLRVRINGFSDTETTTRYYCQTLLRVALQRSTNPHYTATFLNGNVRFLFYASQLRPNKNVMLLLRAYKYLLRERYLGHKLILTGNPSDFPEIGRFVVDHRLESDVIFLPGLSVAELAACYKLADLAVNPSLSEGGCPFTFSEALSVGTPVVMARIPVTEEVLSEPELQRVTLFDPYDWRSCAERIEWAILNRDALLPVQLAVHGRLSERTWVDVTKEYVAALDRISAESESRTE
ncbi:glycoside hydrolase [Pseudomonas sp. Pc102]|uniref:glycosyltransferase n=1 Tax=Pseudomonas sp. Pc102 TaxID=2678261 RepID=UPI001BCEB79E|nr:glycosyltransferase [Pseudomonas sp. Pc102]BBP86045.1 glycoside hydrolase [Pseudomonas sp. Pc102]